MNYTPIHTEQVILCCSCGTPIPPNPANMCVNCIRNEVDITEGIPKQSTLHYCKNCERYLQPPNHWVLYALESKELLGLCLKKLKGLTKVRLIDASFIWTEPHSKRIKVKVTVQKEVFASTILQQTFEVEFVVSYQQCEDCAKIMAQNTWKASVQVRQKVNHKRTFLYLEQLILKHNAHRDTTNIKEAKDGIDFFYVSRGHAIKMCEFLASVVPVRIKTSEQLISLDTHSGSSSYKFTYSVEIIPICKDDLVCMPKSLARNLSNMNTLAVCSRVSNSVQIIDFNTLNTGEMSTDKYYRTPFKSIAAHDKLVEFVVLDVEPIGPVRGKYALADIQVARISDYGKNDTTFITRSHLGNILKFGDYAYGYDLSTANFNDSNFDELNEYDIPSVVLIKKSYSNRRKKPKQRTWKLKSLAKDADQLQMRKTDLDKMETDYEIFLRDIEEDLELRSSINLFKENNPRAQQPDQMETDETTQAQDQMDEDDDFGDEDDDFPEIKLEELLDDLNLDDGEEDEGEYQPEETSKPVFGFNQLAEE